MGNNNKATYYQPIGEGEPPEGLKKKIEKMKKKKKKYKSPGSPHEGETKASIRKSLNIGKGRKAAKKTKKYAKKLGTAFTESFMDTSKLLWEGAKKTRKKIGKLSDIKTGFTREMIGLKKGGRVRMNKGGPVDARKIAKKYFKGTF